MEQYGKYELVRRVGRGGMAEVFLAKSAVAQGLAKTLVIKKIHPAFARSNQFIAMFVDEAKIAIDLNHPSIVQVFDFGTVGGSFFLAMEYVEGLDLLRLMQVTAKAQKRFPIGLAAYIVQELCKGLDYAHRKTDQYGEALGIVHRDVSPQNVLLSWDGAVKIVDFGIARARHVHEEEGVIKGKFAYMSPEQARGEPVDRRSDVFSAGIVLYELVCGKPAFPGKGKEVLESVRAGAITRPRDINEAIPEELEQTVLRALAFHRDDRFQTARDLQNALGRFLFRYADEHAQQIDSGRLAQFVATVVPSDDRSPVSRPPTAAGHRGAVARSAGSRATANDVDHDGTGGPGATPLPRTPSEVRERKHVYVIEGRICGLASLERRLGADSAAQTVSSFIRMASDIAYKHDAHVHHSDDAGFIFIVGLPAAAEDDATRTMRLALALIDALDAVGQDVEPELRLAVGVQRGNAVLKRTGGTRFSYELSAATNSVARRLATAAHGAEVLVGGGVYRIAATDWNFEAVASIQIAADPDTQPGVTGDSQPAKVYKLRGRKERAQRMRERAVQTDKDLVGRELELKALRDGYRDVLVSGRKRHFVVIGEAGIGKRSLVSAFLAGIPKDEAIVARAAARAATRHTPFAIIADLGRDLLGLAEGADGKEVRRRVELVVSTLHPSEPDSREMRGLVQAIGLLLGARFDEGELQIDAEERAQRIRDALLRVERTLSADKPLIVVGEDVHWADDQSRDLFIELLKIPTSRPVLGIVTGRPEPRVLQGATETGGDVLPLEELRGDARLRLVTARFAADDDVQDLAQQIVTRAGGNPFFIREVLDALIEKGIVEEESDSSGLLRWVKRDAPIQVPTRVEALVATRIDMLPAEVKQTLTMAAVVGRVFTAEQVEALAGSSRADDLRALVDRGLIGRDGAGFVFRNEMTMTVAYQLLPTEDRTQLHLDAARRLENASGYRKGQDDAIVARHFELGLDAHSAAERYLSAADHAIDVGGGSEALQLLSRAVKLLASDDHARRFDAHQKREDILRHLGRRPQQLREIDRMRKNAEELGDDYRLAHACTRLTQFYIDVNKPVAARRAVNDALAAAQRAGNPFIEADARRLEATIERQVGNNDRALELCSKALELCDDSRQGLLQRAPVLNVRGIVLWHTARLGEAIEAFAEALVIYRMLERRRDEARVLNNMGIGFAEMGEYEEALGHQKSSLQIDRELGDRAGIAFKLGNIGQTYTDAGDIDRGERYLKKALKIADHSKDERSTTDVVISLGQVKLRRGQPGRAREYLERGLALASASTDRYQENRAKIYIAFAMLETGASAEQALELAEDATRTAHKMPMPVGEIYGLAAQALALVKLDRAEDGAARAAQATALQDETRYPVGREFILHIDAQVAEHAGLTDRARESTRRAWETVQTKASRLRDEQLRAAYLDSSATRAIVADYQRLFGS